MAYRRLGDRIGKSLEQRKFPSQDPPVGREKELAAIKRIIGLVKNQPSPLHIWIWGPPGSGKTHCVMHVVSELAKLQQISAAYSNCWNSNSLYALVNDIIDQFSILRAELQDTRFKIDRIKKHIKDQQCIFVIDEIDRLDSKERNAVLYQFQDLSNVWIVAISHTEPYKLGIEPRVWSRLSPIQVAFNQYSVGDIEDLLKKHIELSDYKSQPSPIQIREVAEQAQGDAQRAKKLLTQKVILGLDDLQPKQDLFR